MRLIFCVFACSVAACTSFEPRPDPYADLEPKSRESVAEPAETPQFPRMASTDGGVALMLDGERIGTLTPSGAAWLAEVDTIAHGNERIAEAHTAALRASQAERDAILESAKAEFELAELRGRMLHEERQGGWICKIPTISVLGLGAWIGAQ